MSDIDLSFEEALKCDICGKIIVSYRQVIESKYCDWKCYLKAKKQQRKQEKREQYVAASAALENEIWKTIEWCNKYQVSNAGRVRTNTDKFNHQISEWRILKGTTNQGGYKDVTLRYKGKTRTFRVHRLVMQTFKPIENAENMLVDHINGDRLDNRLENLRWATPKLNSNNRHNQKQRIDAIKIEDNYGNIFNSYSEASKYWCMSLNTIRNHATKKAKKWQKHNDWTPLDLEFSII